MISDIDNPNLPPPTLAGFSAWLTGTRERLRRLAHTPGTNLGHLEIALLEDLHRLGVPLLTQAASLQGQATPFLCPRCQKPLQREAKNHRRKVESAVVPLRLVPAVPGLVLPRRCPLGIGTQRPGFPPRSGNGGRSGA